MSPKYVTTRQQRPPKILRAALRLPRSLPDASCAPFPTSLTTTVFSQCSSGRFEITPAGRLRRANILHLPCSTAIDYSTTSSSLPRSWHTFSHDVERHPGFRQVGGHFLVLPA